MSLFDLSTAMLGVAFERGVAFRGCLSPKNTNLYAIGNEIHIIQMLSKTFPSLDSYTLTSSSQCKKKGLCRNYFQSSLSYNGLLDPLSSWLPASWHVFGPIVRHDEFCHVKVSKDRSRHGKHWR